MYKPMCARLCKRLNSIILHVVCHMKQNAKPYPLVKMPSDVYAIVSVATQFIYSYITVTIYNNY